MEKLGLRVLLSCLCRVKNILVGMVCMLLSVVIGIGRLLKVLWLMFLFSVWLIILWYRLMEMYCMGGVWFGVKIVIIWLCLFDICCLCFW